MATKRMTVGERIAAVLPHGDVEAWDDLRSGRLVDASSVRRLAARARRYADGWPVGASAALETIADELDT